MRDPIMRSVAARALGSIAALSLLALTGCNKLDPLKRPYMWQATGSNEQNIAAMAANPADLIHGQDSQRRRASMDTDSVMRVWTGKTVPLMSDTAGSTSAPSSGSGAAASTGGGS
jgi:hypothetical protein